MRCKQFHGSLEQKIKVYPTKLQFYAKDSVFIDGILKQFGLSKTGFKSTCCEAYQMVSNSFCQENIQISISECDNSVTPYLL